MNNISYLRNNKQGTGLSGRWAECNAKICQQCVINKLNHFD
nr:MAG TPA: hypothetical protein [Caudoviricetes sp.]